MNYENTLRDHVTYQHRNVRVWRRYGADIAVRWITAEFPPWRRRSVNKPDRGIRTGSCDMALSLTSV